MPHITISKEVHDVIKANALTYLDERGSTQNIDGSITIYVDDEVAAAIQGDPDTFLRNKFNLPPKKLN